MATPVIIRQTNDFVFGYYIVDNPATETIFNIGLKPSRVSLFNHNLGVPVVGRGYNLTSVAGATYEGYGVSDNYTTLVADCFYFLNHEHGFKLGVIAGGFNDIPGHLLLWEAWR